MQGVTRNWTWNQTLPRKLPIWLIARVWLNNQFLSGYIALCVAAAAIVFLLSSDQLPGDWLLTFDRQLAQGSLTDVTKVMKKSGKNAVAQQYFRYSYTFTLPDGRTLSGASTSSSNRFVTFGRPGDARAIPVSVEYSPARPEKNRIAGTQIEDSKAFTAFGLILPIIGITLIVRGIFQALVDCDLLRRSVLGDAIVTHCIRDKRTTSFAEFSVGEFSFRRIWKKSKEITHEIPLAEYQAEVIERHRSQFDSQGKYHGTRRDQQLFTLLAGILGAIFGSLLGLVFCTFLGLGLNLWLIFVGMAGGASVSAACEWRWRFLLRSSTKKKVDDPPSGFTDILCVLQLPTVNTQNPERFRHRLTLQGDPSDAAPHPVLYVESPKFATKLLSQIEWLSTSMTNELGLVMHVSDLETRLLALPGGVIAIAVALVLGLT